MWHCCPRSCAACLTPPSTCALQNGSASNKGWRRRGVVHQEGNLGGAQHRCVGDRATCTLLLAVLALQHAMLVRRVGAAAHCSLAAILRWWLGVLAMAASPGTSCAPSLKFRNFASLGLSRTQRNSPQSTPCALRSSPASRVSQRTLSAVCCSCISAPVLVIPCCLRAMQRN